MAATRGGVFDYIAKPFDLDVMIDAIERAEAARATRQRGREEEMPETEMIGNSAAMVEIYKMVARVAPTDATVIIEGETGTGKELVARMIWRYSRRAAQPFVAVDCGSIAPSLLESDLFGAMRGALHRRRPRPHRRLRSGQPRHGVSGRDRRHRAQLSVGPAALSREPRDPPGGRRAVQGSGRARDRRHQQRPAAHGGGGQVSRGSLVPAEHGAHLLPPLRERRADIPQLARFFANKYNSRYNRGVKLMDSGMKALQEYTWPGNVRQLQHLIERLTVLADRIDAEAVRDALTIMESREKPVDTLADAEEDQIRRVLAATGGNKSKAAQLLGIERKTLYRKLERMKL